MSDLALKEFHTFLEDLIEKSSVSGGFSVDRTIQSLIVTHPQVVAKVQDHINELGLRALIRNNCRAKNRATATGPDMFGHFRVGKMVSVPYHDNEGKLRWVKKPRNQLLIVELDEILARSAERPAEPSKERRDLAEIARRIAPYRTRAKSVAEALQLAAKDEK